MQSSVGREYCPEVGNAVQQIRNTVHWSGILSGVQKHCPRIRRYCPLNEKNYSRAVNPAAAGEYYSKPEILSKLQRILLGFEKYFPGTAESYLRIRDTVCT